MAHDLTMPGPTVEPWHGINPMRGRLTSLPDICRFMSAGNATITLVSKKTGERRTFKIDQADDNPNLYFVSLLAGPDNESDFFYLGTIRNMKYQLGKKSAFTETSTPHVVFNWFFGNLMRSYPKLLEQLDVWHEGRCGRCGRKLTVPESIEQGFGPECIKWVCK